jgi:hypothetical protein
VVVRAHRLPMQVGLRLGIPNHGAAQFFQIPGLERLLGLVGAAPQSIEARYRAAP